MLSRSDPPLAEGTPVVSDCVPGFRSTAMKTQHTLRFGFRFLATLPAKSVKLIRAKTNTARARARLNARFVHGIGSLTESWP